MARRVVLVTGPPCAGKTTYVHTHAQPDDTICDQDDLGPTAMRRAMARVARMTEGTAWVIRCCPTAAERHQLATYLRADQVLTLRPPDDVLMRRAAHRPHSREAAAAVASWLRTADTTAATNSRRW